MKPCLCSDTEAGAAHPCHFPPASASASVNQGMESKNRWSKVHTFEQNSSSLNIYSTEGRRICRQHAVQRSSSVFSGVKFPETPKQLRDLSFCVDTWTYWLELRKSNLSDSNSWGFRDEEKESSGWKKRAKMKKVKDTSHRSSSSKREARSDPHLISLIWQKRLFQKRFSKNSLWVLQPHRWDCSLLGFDTSIGQRQSHRLFWAPFFENTLFLDPCWFASRWQMFNDVSWKAIYLSHATFCLTFPNRNAIWFPRKRRKWQNRSNSQDQANYEERWRYKYKYNSG